LADCDDPTTWLSILKHGRARYVYAINVKRLPQDPMDLHRYSGYENTRLPTKTPMRLVPGDYIVYDVFSGKQVSPRKKDKSTWEVEADMSLFPGAILALLPAAIDRLLLSSSQAAEGNALRVQVQIADAEGRTIDGAIPLEVVIEDASGGRRYHLYRTAVHGLWDETFPVASNDVPGRWRVAVTERLSGRQVVGDFAVKVPPLPEAKPTPVVEWTRQERIAEALRRARHVALVVEDKQTEPFAAIIRLVRKWLQKQGKNVEQVRATDYLADRQKYQWDKFKLGSQDRADVRLRPRKYDLVVTFDTPDIPGGIVPPDLLPIAMSRADPGPGRGLVQYVVMPVYDTEDAVALAGGDLLGLLAAARSLASPPEPGPAAHRPTVPLTPIDGAARTVRQLGLQEFIGIPVGELAATPDGQRIAVGLKGWGNNVLVLDSAGKIIAKDACGKFFPVNLRALDDGFTVVTHENDPTTLYLKLYDRDGKPKVRLASAGRRVGGVRDWSPSIPNPDVMLPFLQQATFSVTPDGRFAAVGGSKAVAVWDVSAGKLLWRDDSVHYTAPGPQNVATDPLEMAPSFPQLRLSPDGKTLALQHNGITTLRDGRTGQQLRELPTAGTSGAVHVFDGRALVLGNPHLARPPFSEFTACRDGERLWKWQAPRPVTAVAFAPDGLRYAVGEVDGTLRLMEGAGQVAGWVSPNGAVGSLSLNPAGERVAFATTGGWIGVMDFGGRVLWQKDLGTRAVIQLLGTKGDTVVGDWCGVVRRFGPAGDPVWQEDLTPHVWREDLATALTSPDRTPTLRLPPPDYPKVTVPDGARNLARSASVKLLRPKAWVGDDWSPIREVSLNDGKKEPPPGGWFNRPTVEYAAFVPSPPAWELEWKQPVTLNTIVVYESKEHPEAVPEEVRIEAWVGGTWKVVRHEFWNSGVVHAHSFETVTATKLRYMPMGDLAKNIWISEIEAFNVVP
jgi:WD40 repeat protein